MRWLLSLTLCAANCATYSTTRYEPAHVRTYLPGERASSNRCSGHEAEVDLVFAAVDRALGDDAAPSRWGDDPITVCIVEARPYVICGGYPLAGCAYPSGAVYVSTLYAQRAPPTPGYDWRKTLVHELVGLLAMRGGLKGVPADQGAAWEAALVASAPYQRVTQRVVLW